MKIRMDFVTNSSSSSFVIDANKISDFQREVITNYKDFIESIKDYLIGYDIGAEYVVDNEWSVTFDSENNTISCYCTMNNFDLKSFITDILCVPAYAISED